MNDLSQNCFFTIWNALVTTLKIVATFLLPNDLFARKLKRNVHAGYSDNFNGNTVES